MRCPPGRLRCQWGTPGSVIKKITRATNCSPAREVRNPFRTRSGQRTAYGPSNGPFTVRARTARSRSTRFRSGSRMSNARSAIALSSSVPGCREGVCRHGATLRGCPSVSHLQRLRNRTIHNRSFPVTFVFAPLPAASNGQSRIKKFLHTIPDPSCFAPSQR